MTEQEQKTFTALRDEAETCGSMIHEGVLALKLFHDELDEAVGNIDPDPEETWTTEIFLKGYASLAAVLQLATDRIEEYTNRLTAAADAALKSQHEKRAEQ